MLCPPGQIRAAGQAHLSSVSSILQSRISLVLQYFSPFFFSFLFLGPLLSLLLSPKLSLVLIRSPALPKMLNFRFAYLACLMFWAWTFTGPAYLSKPSCRLQFQSFLLPCHAESTEEDKKRTILDLLNFRWSAHSHIIYLFGA